MNQTELTRDTFFWTLQGICALHRKPFSSELAQQQLAAPHTPESLVRAAQALGFDAETRKIKLKNLRSQTFPLIVWLRQDTATPPTNGQAGSVDTPPHSTEDRTRVAPALVMQADERNALVIGPADSKPITVALAEFEQRYLGHATRISPCADLGNDPDTDLQSRQARRFGFSWFVPELLKYKKLWQEVLLASLVIQLIALATPLFTQAIIDKVVVHHTQSTLIVIAIGMALFMVFSAGLSWLRQYLVLHTGNRVDAVLGSAVFDRLFKLPPLYFQHRPTGVIAARLHGVETIREFIASAAVTLVLDLPFLLILGFEVQWNGKPG